MAGGFCKAPRQRASAARPAHAVHTRVQVLSDPDQRKIYDVYGREGLRAGLEVGDKYKGLEELRKQWKAFQAQSQQVRVATEVAPATLIEITSNASSLVSSINFEGGTHFIPILGVYYEPIWPVVTSTAFHHTLSFKVSDETSITVGGAHRALARCSALSRLQQQIHCHRHAVRPGGCARGCAAAQRSRRLQRSRASSSDGSGGYIRLRFGHVR